VVRGGRVAARTPNRWDDAVIELVRRTGSPVIIAGALWPAAESLTLPTEWHAVLRAITVLAVAWQTGIWGQVLIAQAIGARAHELRAEHPEAATTLNAVSVLARIALYAVLLLLALENLGVNVSALIAGLGIGGVAVALATQNILGDLFAALSIALDRPFVVGDFIIVGDAMGTVERIGLKTTRVRSLSGEQIVFANGDLLKSRLHNYKRMAERRVVFTVGVTYETPLEKLQALPGQLKDIVSARDLVRFDRAHLRSYDDWCITFEVVYYVLSPDYNRYMDIQQAINFEIYRRFDAEGLEFAYPTKTVYVKNS
jgi:small-conductance mechanosensitive channel